MLKSMTGYGRGQVQTSSRDIMVEIRSVNHRFFEYSSRVQRQYSYLDEKLKTFLQTQISRGKVDVNVTINTTDGTDENIKINKSLALEYVNALRDLNETIGITDDLSLSSISKFNDIFTVTKVAQDIDEVWAEVKVAVQIALENFITMRELEGERLFADINLRLSSILESVSIIEEKAPKTISDYKDKLYQKITEVLADKNIDDARVLTEVAIFADKIAVDEETVRLKSHIKQFEQLILLHEPVGRKLDFLVQELNREVNTIGSKCQDITVTEIVVNMKSEIEKIREQIQNIE
ncbi:MAG: YicC/YloC family endoribonuclease [Oscillospiraceae bacterium]